MAGALQQTNSKTANLTAYKDSDHIAAWAGNSVAAVSKLGLMKGDETGYFRPADAIKAGSNCTYLSGAAK